MFYSFLRNCARLFYIIVYHIHVIGGENIPKEKGGYIIASNHVSNNDPPVVGITFKGKYTFMAKEELFEINPIFSWLISKLGAFPVRRGAKDNTAIEKALESLGEGRIFVIFPEGTRSKDGEIHRFKAGAFLLAREAGVPILPVVLDGTRTLIGPKAMFNWRNRITVRVLPPVGADEVAASDPKLLGDRVHDRMVRALGQIRNK